MNEYEKYKLEWMIAHGHSLKELIREIADACENHALIKDFDEWENYYGFGTEIWACEAEWDSGKWED